jgi:hypothetical protein
MILIYSRNAKPANITGQNDLFTVSLTLSTSDYIAPNDRAISEKLIRKTKREVVVT